MASIPGNTLPSRNSNEAPPPVDTCVISSLYPAFSTANALSPPPTIVTPSDSVRAFAIE